MDLKATLASSYRNRLILIAVAAMLYSAWCTYDALYGYPKKERIYEKFVETQEKYPDTWSAEWEKTATEQGWDTSNTPEAPGDWDIATQWIQFAVVFPIGAYCLFSLAMWQRRYIGADESKLYSHAMDGVTFDAVTRIDAARWESKGIAVIYYDAGQGEKSLVLDDWKYEREPSDAIFDRLRENIGEDKITGLTEPMDPDAEDPGDGEDIAGQDQGDTGTQAEADRESDTKPTASS